MILTSVVDHFNLRFQSLKLTANLLKEISLNITINEFDFFRNWWNKERQSLIQSKIIDEEDEDIVKIKQTKKNQFSKKNVANANVQLQ